MEDNEHFLKPDPSVAEFETAANNFAGALSAITAAETLLSSLRADHDRFRKALEEKIQSRGTLHRKSLQRRRDQNLRHGHPAEIRSHQLQQHGRS